MEIRRRALLGGAAAATAAAVAAGARGAVAPQDRPTPSNEDPLRMVNLEELEERARQVLAPGPFAFVAGGTGAEATLRRNRTAIEQVIVEPHYLNSTPAPDTRTTLMGAPLPAPLIIAPVGGQGVFHTTADLGTARGATEAGWLMTASGASTASLEQIAQAVGPGPKWYQIYMPADRGFATELLQRVKAAGYTAVVFSIDALGAGNSEALQRTGYALGPALQAASARIAAGQPAAPSRRGPQKLSIGWDDVAFIASTTGLPVILKGVLSPALAKAAVQRGAAGLQVSNHGGRQLDGVRAAIDALPAVRDAVGDRPVIVVDSGFRRGLDVFKAMALGADAVAIGRPAMYGLALGGAPGVRSVCEKLQAELRTAMQSAGAATIAAIDRSYVAKA
jgi:isopentenyl diphosphate isomerase/L-lactate dehydrogenase-like FMN-dependent dehydrogenase